MFHAIDVLTVSSQTFRLKNDGEVKYPVSSFVLNCKGATSYFCIEIHILIWMRRM
jgi:hypothetical protein